MPAMPDWKGALKKSGQVLRQGALGLKQYSLALLQRAPGLKKRGAALFQGALELRKHSRFLWLGALGLLALLCVGMVISIWFSGKHEAIDAFDSGRRLIVAVDTGEIKGKIITLDAPVAKKPLPLPAEEELPTSQETPPSGAEATPAQSPAEIAEDTPPVTPMPDVNPALVERTEAGNLPVIGSDGSKAWRAYSKPFERKRNLPMVAVIVSNLGLARVATQDALHLPEYFTISFSPYVRDVASWNAAARATGHEMLIDLAMEPGNFPLADPGPEALFASRGPEENEKHVQWMLARFPTAMGFLMPQNESFTASDDNFKLLLQSFANRGLMVIMGHEPNRKESKELLDASHTAAAIGDILIDEEPSATAIQTRLSQLEEQAKKHGYAIGIAQPYPVTVSQLRAWSKTLEEKGVVLVPVSAIIKLRFS